LPAAKPVKLILKKITADMMTRFSSSALKQHVAYPINDKAHEVRYYFASLRWSRQSKESMSVSLDNKSHIETVVLMHHGLGNR